MGIDEGNSLFSHHSGSLKTQNYSNLEDSMFKLNPKVIKQSGSGENNSQKIDFWMQIYDLNQI